MNKFDPPSDPYGDVKHCKICDSILEYEPFTKEWVCKKCDNDECPDCGGSGEVAGDYYSDDGMMTCERCKGKGTI